MRIDDSCHSAAGVIVGLTAGCLVVGLLNVFGSLQVCSLRQLATALFGFELLSNYSPKLPKTIKKTIKTTCSSPDLPAGTLFPKTSVLIPPTTDLSDVWLIIFTFTLIPIVLLLIEILDSVTPGRSGSLWAGHQTTLIMMVIITEYNFWWIKIYTSCMNLMAWVVFMQLFFWIRIVNIWNDLPDKIVSAPSVASFKHRLLSFDLSHYVLYWCFVSFILYFMGLRKSRFSCLWVQLSSVWSQ